MKLLIPTFDQFRAFAKKNQNALHTPKKVRTKQFLSTKLPSKVPFIIADDRKGWDADEQALVLPASESVMTVLHEAWHYFMCPPDMLQHDNFGLGGAEGIFGLKERVPVSRKKEGAIEEEAVCYFTVATAMALKVPIGTIMEEMDYANLIEPFMTGGKHERDGYAKALRLSQKRNLSRFGFDIRYA